MTEPEISPQPVSPGCGARIALFIGVGLLGSLVSLFGLLFLFEATGPKGPDSGMGNGLAAAFFAPFGGILFGLLALWWQARFDRGRQRTGIVAAACLVVFLLAVFAFYGLGVI